MYKGKFKLIVFILLCLLLKEISLVEGGTQLETNNLIQGLQNAKTLSEMDSVSIRIAQNRLDLIRTSIGILRSNASKDKMIRACFLLGEYRATEAITDLSNRIALEDKIKEKLKELPLWGKYPALEALIKIGFSAIPQMIQILETNKDNHIQRLSSTVIWEVIGRNSATIQERKNLAHTIINNAIKIQSDPLKKKNLENALKLLN